MYRKNEIIELDITSLTSDGDGVGRAGELVFFVPNTAVGDTIRAKVLKVKKNVGFARVEEVMKPSADRIEPECPVSFSCGGCVYRHISYEAECSAKRRKVIDAVKRIGKLDAELVREIIPSENIDGYRNKAMIPVGLDRDGKVVIEDGWYKLIDTMREFNDAGIVANLGSWGGEWASAWNDGTLLIRVMPSWDFFTDWGKNTGNVGVAAPFMASYEGGTYRAIYANSEKKELCAKFIEFLTTEEYQLQNLYTNNQMPANKNIVNVLGPDYTNASFGGQNIMKTYDTICNTIPDIVPDKYTRDLQNKFSNYAQNGVREGLSNEQIVKNFLDVVRDTYPELDTSAFN